MFSPVATGAAPGAAVMVVQDGKVLHAKAYGLANLEHQVRCTTQTKFRIVSLTKAFTAMAVLILHQEGRLNIDDPIKKYLPDHPAGEKITIRQLLTHTAGVEEPAPKPGVVDMLPKTNTPLDKRYAMCRDQPLEFEPGTRWSYSNGGYIVLGYLLEKVTGQPYEKILQERIFGPLGMKDTGYDHNDVVLRNRASGYQRDGKSYKNAEYFDMSLFGPSGCLYSTVEDMRIWDQALDGERLVKADLLRQVFTRAKLNNGSSVAYGFGWILARHRGLEVARATGMMPGFEAQIVRFPSHHFSVIVLSNSLDLGVFKLAHQIAEIYLEEVMEPAAK